MREERGGWRDARLLIGIAGSCCIAACDATPAGNQAQAALEGDDADAGAQSELRDVTEGPQPADLFVVPADYKKVELPQRPPQGQAVAPAAPPR